jgi:hypothetical protein
MEPAPIQILSRAAFDLMLLSAGRHGVASIREQEADPTGVAVTIRGIELAEKIKKQQFNLKPLTREATTY